MLHTKHQSPKPSIFREEEFQSFPSLFELVTPMEGPVLTQGAGLYDQLSRSPRGGAK